MAVLTVLMDLMKGTAQVCQAEIVLMIVNLINSSVMEEESVLTPQENVMVTMTVLIALMSKTARLVPEGNHASRGNLGVAMAFASRWKGAAMATMTARIGAMNLIVLVSAELVNSGATMARVSLNVRVVMGAETVQMDLMKASVLPVAGLIRYDAMVVAV